MILPIYLYGQPALRKPTEEIAPDTDLNIKQLIADNNISGIKEMGKLMGLASKQFAGKADNKQVSLIVKQLLS